MKYDGYRVQLHLDDGKAKAFTRNGLNWVKRFSTIAGAFDILGQAVVDGEVVVVHEGDELLRTAGRARQRRPGSFVVLRLRSFVARRA
ncbi:hypothetical protein [Bradyrhizobium genosp. L]|uniref:ATP-dependent DNA ligase n=1 Tax=Bradyrhizobium genosp. L TaxID=83637 RepID=UPI0032DF745D